MYSVKIVQWYFKQYISILLLVELKALNYDINGFSFHAYDIFDDKLMPMQILSQHELAKLFNNETAEEQDTFFHSPSTDKMKEMRGFDFDAALNSMEYHRRMMNEFMATDYITQQILHETVEKASSQSLKPDDVFPSGIRKRMGEVKSDASNASKHANLTFESPNNTSTNSHNSNHKLLNDEGMTRYKTWLRKYALLNKIPALSTGTSHNVQRSVTLKDIQRQMHTQSRYAGTTHKKRKPQSTAQQQNRRQVHTLVHPNEKIDLASDYADEEQDFEDGDITGYAFTANPYDYANLQQSTAQQNLPLTTGTDQSVVPAVLNVSPLAKAINKNGYETSPFEDYSSGTYQAPAQHPSPIDSHVAPAPVAKEIGLKDITDIALTTLAFLSFGMFILQVLMCITMGKEDTNNMMMMPMEAPETNDMGDGVEEIRRKRRSTPDANRRLVMMNDLARRALFSVDAVLKMPDDKGVCNYWSLCENNRFARTQPNGQKYWIPIWSLGVSWFTSRVSKGKTLPIQTDYLTIMQSLKAIIIGLATDNCEKFYSNSCTGMASPLTSPSTQTDSVG